MSGISDSASFNSTSSYYFPANGTSVVGVQSLNAKAGTVTLSSTDNSVNISSGGASAIEVSTAGTNQNLASLTATGNVSGSTITASGGLIGNSLSLATNNIVAGLTSTGSQFKTTVSTPISLNTGNNPLTFLNAFIGTATPHMVMWNIQGQAGVSDSSYMGGITLFKGGGFTTNPNGLPILMVQNQANSFAYIANGSVNPVIMQYTNSGPAQTATLNYTVIF
jgi:hypothetical protein